MRVGLERMHNAHKSRLKGRPRGIGRESTRKGLLVFEIGDREWMLCPLLRGAGGNSW